MSLLLGLTLSQTGFAQSFPFRCSNLAEGLSQSVVNTLTEGSQGFLWIGTASGLSRFDGQLFVNYDQEDGLPSLRIYALFEDSSRILWVGTDRGVARFDGQRWHASFADSQLGTHRTPALTEEVTADGSRRLIIGTRGAGLFAAQDGEVHSLSSMKEGKIAEDAPAAIFSLLNHQGTVWAGTNLGLYRLHGEQLEVAFAEAPWVGVKIQALAVDDTGQLLLATDHGGYQVDSQSGVWQQIVEPSAGELTAVTVDRQGRVWFGTHHQGLLRRNDAQWRRLGEGSGLPTEGIRALAKHSDGGLWIGTYGGGLCRLNDESFSLFTKDHGLPNDQVISLAEDSNGDLWVGMLEGGVSRFDGEIFENFGLQDGLRSLAVSHMAVDGAGTLWVGTLRGGLHRRITARQRVAFETVDLGVAKALTIFHLLVDRQDRLWISTWGDGLFHLDPTIGDVQTLDEDLISRRIFSTSQAPDGAIWIATTDGVQVLDPSTWTLSGFETTHNAPRGRVRTVVHAANEHTLLATDRGIARWDGQTFSYFGRQQGLASNNLYLATLDSKDQLWVGSERGLDRFQLDDQGELKNLRYFGADEGFVGLETNQNAVLEDSHGRLWFGTHGLARFEPAEETTTQVPPRLLLTKFRLFDGTPLPFPKDAPTIIPWDRNNLVFEFIGLDFTAPEALRYRYRLHGPEDGWSPPSSSRSAVFSRLPPGPYSFEVAALSRGTWGESTKLSFVIRPPLWATWWFRGGAILAIGLLATFWLRSRELRNKQRRIELEQAVDERTQELVLAKQVAEDANTAKSEFLSNMSHELRTPLTGVVSAAELLAVTHLDGKQLHLIETIQTSGRALLSVVNDILDQSKIEARGLQIDAREFSPPTCFEECLQIIRHNAEVKGLDLVNTIGAGIPERAVGDPVRFRQVLINLLGNAIKFTDQGHISASLKKGEERGDRLQLLVEVRDTGIGISEAQQRRIFEPFEQADMTLTRSFGGTGLGLSICERLVAMMGGTIRVESEPGQGSTFRFDVEVGLPAAATISEVSIAQGFPGIRGGLKVLLAEDNPVSQMITGSQLENLGLHPHITSNGADAVLLAQTLIPDIIFMDGQMPGMDGYAATQAIRVVESKASNGGLAHRAVIVGFTAHATAEARGRCLAAGMDDYLSKPVSLESLAECLARWFPRNEPAADSHSRPLDS